jgi:uncharacterized damage-inducible protein DinB
VKPALLKKEITKPTNWRKMMEKLSQLFDYHAWATDKLLGYIEQEVPGAFSAQMKSVFPSIEETFQHQLEVDLLWYGRMNKEFQGEYKTLSSPGAYRKAFQELHGRSRDSLQAVRI